MVLTFSRKIRKDNRKELNSKLFETQSKISKEERLPKIKKDFTYLLALKNKEHLIKTEIRNRQIRKGEKNIEKLEKERDKKQRKKLK